MTPALAQSAVEHVVPLWERLRGAELFMTGGTGFLGRWLVAAFVAANARHRLEARMTLLTRSRARFARRSAELAGAPGITLLEGDVRDFAFPRRHFDFVIHGAAEVWASAGERAFDQLQAIVAGTQRTLELARREPRAAFLLVSSGAVYGRVRSTTPIGEQDLGSIDPLDARSAYAEGKHVAEWMAARYGERGSVRARIARCFAMLGPGMDLDAHFAAASFLRSALDGAPIVVRGGHAVRSYLYAGDAAAWLWRILLDGEDGAAYNVGAETAVTTAELASMVGRAAGVEVREEAARVPALSGDYFVPSTRKAREGLAVREWTPLPRAVEETLAWYRRTGT